MPAEAARWSRAARVTFLAQTMPSSSAERRPGATCWWCMKSCAEAGISLALKPKVAPPLAPPSADWVKARRAAAARERWRMGARGTAVSRVLEQGKDKKMTAIVSMMGAQAQPRLAQEAANKKAAAEAAEAARLLVEQANAANGRASMTNEMMSYEITVPADARAGDVLQTRTPFGTKVKFRVPPNTPPGTVLTFNLPRDPQSPVTGRQPPALAGPPSPPVSPPPAAAPSPPPLSLSSRPPSPPRWHGEPPWSGEDGYEEEGSARIGALARARTSRGAHEV